MVVEEKEGKYTGGAEWQITRRRRRAYREHSTRNVSGWPLLYEEQHAFVQGKKFPLYEMKDIGINGTLMRSFLIWGHGGI